jgi:hypothetical protein
MSLSNEEINKLKRVLVSERKHLSGRELRQLISIASAHLREIGSSNYRVTEEIQRNRLTGTPIWEFNFPVSKKENCEKRRASHRNFQVYGVLVCKLHVSYTLNMIFLDICVWMIVKMVLIFLDCYSYFFWSSIFSSIYKNIIRSSLKIFLVKGFHGHIKLGKTLLTTDSVIH